MTSQVWIHALLHNHDKIQATAYCSNTVLSTCHHTVALLVPVGSQGVQKQVQH